MDDSDNDPVTILSSILWVTLGQKTVELEFLF